jgi:hypothetical protein
MRLICIFLLVFSIHFLKAQNSEIVFSPTYGNAKLSLNTNYFLKSINDSIQFTTIKCYVSHITLYKQQEVVYQSSTPKLLDISQSSSLVIKTSISSFDSISFMIGVDSLTQVSGAYGGDLDPTNGMYWTWQSGYINTKIEGNTKACPTRNNQFQQHLGGYLFPYNTNRIVSFRTGSNIIQINFEQWANTIDFTQNHHIMSPGKNAINAMDNFVKRFSTL